MTYYERFPTHDEVSRRYLLMVSILGHREASPENWAVLRRVAAGATLDELMGELRST